MLLLSPFRALSQPILPNFTLQEVSLATAKAEFYFDNTMVIAESDLMKKNKRKSITPASKRKSIKTHYMSADDELDCMHDRQ